MEIYYQGKIITDLVQVRSCIVRDSAGRSDSLSITFENSAKWYSWGPEEDDAIAVEHNGYDSGLMFVDTVVPEDGTYTIIASSLPCKARVKGYESFSGKTLEEIMRTCAVASGMGYAFYGIDPDVVIPYIQRENEGYAAFLSRLIMLEGGVLKCVNGKYTAIGLNYAQNIPAVRTMELKAEQTGLRYVRSGRLHRYLTIRTPYAEATAQDALASDDRDWLTETCFPALDSTQAGRWARGRLMALNRKCECVLLESVYDTGVTAMARMDIIGDTDATGEWVVEEAEHDLVGLTTKAKLHRCIRTVY